MSAEGKDIFITIATTTLFCSRCRVTGRLRWQDSAARLLSQRVAGLSSGFRLIETGDGEARVECAQCHEPVHKLAGRVSGWAPPAQVR
ncbi:MAG: hypothetical protein AB7E79_16485 [Rhodospirillaceae bacterium]